MCEPEESEDDSALTWCGRGWGRRVAWRGRRSAAAAATGTAESPRNTHTQAFGRRVYCVLQPNTLMDNARIIQW